MGNVKETLKRLQLEKEVSGVGTGRWLKGAGPKIESISPIDGCILGTVRSADAGECDAVIAQARQAFGTWRSVPAPQRGEIVRQIGVALRAHKADLGTLVTLEMGKIRAEAEGEVQEMIDIADFAVGQSRMLYGLTMPSERKGHRLFEQWLPMGPVGVITAFNFPVAVWSWNTMLALIAGDTVIWKPSSQTPLCAIAVMNIIWQVLSENNVPEGVCNLIVGDREQVGDPLVQDRRVPLISATGSVAMGRKVAQAVAARLGKTILELGGNNAMIVTDQADMHLAVRAIVFGAVGTAGQRCTTTRRIIVHRSRFQPLSDALVAAYRQVSIGDPMNTDILMGPLVNPQAVAAMQQALKKIDAQGGCVVYGGQVLNGGLYDTGTYVTPCICHAKAGMPIVKQETFAPILYLMAYESLEEAIEMQNDVPQGLSSAIFSDNLTETELFLGPAGSDCGLANVNMGTSGAEIGGAFGGEKETGGGRESGSDAWKAYMRRQTCTINWSKKMPLAQGIRFDVE